METAEALIKHFADLLLCKLSFFKGEEEIPILKDVGIGVEHWLIDLKCSLLLEEISKEHVVESKCAMIVASI